VGSREDEMKTLFPKYAEIFFLDEGIFSKITLVQYVSWLKS